MWQWQQLGHMQVCTSLQTDNPRQHPTAQFFTGQMPFLLPNQQYQSTEGRRHCVISGGQTDPWDACGLPVNCMHPARCRESIAQKAIHRSTGVLCLGKFIQCHLLLYF